MRLRLNALLSRLALVLLLSATTAVTRADDKKADPPPKPADSYIKVEAKG